MTSTSSSPDAPSVQLQANLELEVPKVPNFLRIRGRGTTLPIESLEEEALRSVGDAWTRELLASAARRHRSAQAAANPAGKAVAAARTRAASRTAGAKAVGNRKTSRKKRRRTRPVTPAPAPAK